MKGIHIDFIDERRVVAKRVWEHVPRVGDVVTFQEGVSLIVLHAVWTDDSRRPGQPWVQLICRRAVLG